MPSPEYVKSQLRIPAELHARLNEAAKESGRSMNAEIVHRLEESFPGDMKRVVLERRMDELARAKRHIANLSKSLEYNNAKLMDEPPSGLEWRLTKSTIEEIKKSIDEMEAWEDRVKADIAKLVESARDVTGQTALQAAAKQITDHNSMLVEAARKATGQDMIEKVLKRTNAKKKP